MIRPLATLALVTVLAGAGCGTVTVSASHGINPVMIGPVKGIGMQPNQPGTEGDKVAVFRSMLDESVVSTSVGGSVDTQAYRSAILQTDYYLVLFTNGDPNRRVAIHSFGCGSYFVMALFSVGSETWCDVRGTVHDAPATATLLRGGGTRR